MEQREFEELLDRVVANLNTELISHGIFTSAKEFEHNVRQIIISFVGTHGIEIDFSPHPHVFPDIAVGKFGVEVKFTLHNTWRSKVGCLLKCCFRRFEYLCLPFAHYFHEPANKMSER